MFWNQASKGRSIVDRSAVSSGHCEVDCSFPFSLSEMAYASHRHRSSLGDSQVGKSSCLPPSSNEALGAVHLLDRLLKALPSSTRYQPNINSLCIFHDSLLLLQACHHSTEDTGLFKARVVVSGSIPSQLLAHSLYKVRARLHGFLDRATHLNQRQHGVPVLSVLTCEPKQVQHDIPYSLQAYRYKAVRL